MEAEAYAIGLLVTLDRGPFYAIEQALRAIDQSRRKSRSRTTSVTYLEASTNVVEKGSSFLLRIDEGYPLKKYSILFKNLITDYPIKTK